MGTIALEGLQFFAYHGFYEEEQKTGNRFSVDIYLEVDFSEAAANDELQKTVNYEEIYKIVQEEMGIPSRLLENIIHRIFARVRATFPQVSAAKASISKHNPPIGGICEKAKVTIAEDFFPSQI